MFLFCVNRKADRIEGLLEPDSPGVLHDIRTERLAWIRAASPDEGKMSLPPGQRDLGSFPRFGIALWEPLPSIAEPALIRVAGAVARTLDVPVSRLVELPRREMVADFHCVTGWSVRGLHWSGVAFRTFYESILVPEASPEPGVSHVLFEGLDGFRIGLELADALDADVLLADQLGGTALDRDHGAPVRLVSPKQYAYKSAKHVCCIELHTREPADGYRKGVRRRFLKWLVYPHPRARVAEEERHRYLPTWAVLGIYRQIRRLWIWAFRRRGQS
jgi:DMSO/TMAO reductase YedYZ molybdopterin-dependent catalytic subunit